MITRTILITAAMLAALPASTSAFAYDINGYVLGTQDSDLSDCRPSDRWTQTIQTALTSDRINPSPIEHAADRIDAIELVVGWNHLRFKSQGAQCFNARHGRIQFTIFHIVRQPMLRVSPLILGLFFVKHFGIMVQ
jgi:hypothetical protein